MATGNTADVTGLAPFDTTATVAGTCTDIDTAGSSLGHLDATKSAESIEAEDLLPAPTFAPLAQQSRPHTDPSSCSPPEPGPSGALRASSHPLPLSDSRAQCADADAPQVPSLSPQGTADAADPLDVVPVEGPVDQARNIRGESLQDMHTDPASEGKT